jgi:hypothetical protein
VLSFYLLLPWEGGLSSVELGVATSFLLLFEFWLLEFLVGNFMFLAYGSAVEL